MMDNRINYVIYVVGMVGGKIENRDNPARLIDANALMGLNGIWAALIGKIHHAKIEHKPSLELWGSGEPFREFVYVDDVAKTVQFLLTVEIPEAMDTINIASGTEISIRDLANVISGVIGYKGKITCDASKPDGAMRKALSNRRLASLGWSEFIELKDGIIQTYDWYKREKCNN